MTSDFRPEVEIRPFYTCTMKNLQYNAYLLLRGQNFCILKEIEVEELDGDVGLKCGSANMAVLCMRNASDHNYKNSCVRGYGADTTFYRTHF